MTVVPFKYYLHDNYSHHERIKWISEQTGLDIDPEDALAENIGRPFYEVALDCTLDTETGKVTILGASA